MVSINFSFHRILLGNFHQQVLWNSYPLYNDATNIPLAEPSTIVRHLYYDVQLVPTSWTSVGIWRPAYRLLVNENRLQIYKYSRGNMLSTLVLLKKVLKASSSWPTVFSLGIWPSRWMYQDTRITKTHNLSKFINALALQELFPWYCWRTYLYKLAC